mmetsp:Transcript_8275/g.13844  ORF Transcript_8275/g.13844 Transcript_8275/m.13844 type:complete len:100 (+) Transcript_8275:943-1242(+)
MQVRAKSKKKVDYYESDQLICQAAFHQIKSKKKSKLASSILKKGTSTMGGLYAADVRRHDLIRNYYLMSHKSAKSTNVNPYHGYKEYFVRFLLERGEDL